MSRHLAFVVGPGAGHVNPTLPLVEELVRRGNRVTYVTGQPFCAAVERSGATALEVPWTAPKPGPASAFTADFLASSLRIMQGNDHRNLAAVREHFRGDPPTVVCGDSATSLGALVAEALRGPHVALFPSMASNEHVDLPDPARGPQDRVGLERVLAETNAADARFRRAHGLAESGGAALPAFGSTAALNLVFVPREFQIGADTFDDTYVFCGPSMGERGNRGGWTPPADGSPVLFVSLGTGFHERPEFFTACVEAFGDTRWHVVMAVGDAVRLPEAPANFEVAPFFPQLSVLEHTTVFVSHTGMNSTLESLYHGVPLVSVPQMAEQAVNGDRVAELGLGRRLDTSGITAKVLREAVDAVADDPAITTAVRRFGARLRALDGAAAGADALDRLLDHSSGATTGGRR